MINEHDIAESLHRLMKQALDSGQVNSLAEAEELYHSYQLEFEISENESRDPLQQATLLTAVALSRRVFLGGVFVLGELDVPLAVPITDGKTLGDAVRILGGKICDISLDRPLISIGGDATNSAKSFHIRTVCSGWRGGIVPADSPLVADPGPPVPLAAMLAAALAVNEAFMFLGPKLGGAGRRSVGLSLWNLSSREWLTVTESEPEIRFLPSKLWLIGLGHLGQAYLWGLSLLPFDSPSKLSLVLQDTDHLTRSSDSTCILSDCSPTGTKKTRALAAWAEARGFTAAIHERKFDSSFRRQEEEPSVALCGIDNAIGRRALDQVGFDLVLEAGLGRGHRDFCTLRTHTLPGPRSAAEIWNSDTQPAEDVAEQAAYQKLVTDNALDRCGVTLLANKAVGAPFVGATAACVLLSELLRMLHGGQLNDVVDINLLCVEHRKVLISKSKSLLRNPGFVEVSD